MTQEEKARAYDEALEKSKEFYILCKKCGAKDTVDFLEDSFPELKEESEDEKTERILHSISSKMSLHLRDIFTEEEFQCFDTWSNVWLEKQGEQKSTLPKWKYKKDHTPLLRDSLILNKYGCVAKSPSGAIVSDVWVLDYDELAKLPKEELEKQSEQKPADKVEPKFKVGDWVVHDMSDGRKVIRQIVNITNKSYVLDGKDFNTFYFNDLENDYHLWTIQDAKKGDVLEFGDHGRLVVGIVSYVNKTTGKVDVNCLLENNNFKVGNYYNLDTIKPHPAAKEQRDFLFQKRKEAGYEWDAETKELKKIEEKNLTDFENAMMHIGESFFGNNAGLDPNDTNAIKEQAELLLELAPKQEWSEEDEEHIESIIERLDGMCKKGATFTITKFAVNQDMGWLKSLKERYAWKPKAWEIQILESVIEKGENPKNYSATLHSILEQLKKLKGK